MTMYLVEGIIFDTLKSAAEYARARNKEVIEEIHKCGGRAWRHSISIKMLTLNSGKGLQK